MHRRLRAGSLFKTVWALCRNRKYIPKKILKENTKFKDFSGDSGCCNSFFMSLAVSQNKFGMLSLAKVFGGASLSKAGTYLGGVPCGAKLEVKASSL